MKKHLPFILAIVALIVSGYVAALKLGVLAEIGSEFIPRPPWPIPLANFIRNGNIIFYSVVFMSVCLVLLYIYGTKEKAIDEVGYFDGICNIRSQC